jgi:hypothetical protein
MRNPFREIKGMVVYQQRDTDTKRTGAGER